jgi:hypothetical protein
LEAQGGIYPPLYSNHEFSTPLVGFSDPKFFDAFKKAFPDLTEQNHYRWAVEKK